MPTNPHSPNSSDVGAVPARAGGINPRHALTAPVIYSLILPFAVLDLWVTLYQAICFSAYRIPKVRRRDYIRIDRYHLRYLNRLQKLNCIYCGYVNGLIAFTAEVAGRTEAFWCPIKHEAKAQASHRFYGEFVDYGDGSDFETKLEIARARLRQIGSAPAQADDDVDLR